jgi:dTDP-4-amino-4,6-dideoxygalactose transaminase
LQEQRIQTSLHYPCVPDFTAFQSAPGARLENGIERARDFAARAMTLPLWPSMTQEQVRQVCSALRAI